MADNPYTAVSISGYNASPPPDDGTRDSTNQLTWAFHTAKIGDPLKTGVEGVDTNVSAAFGDLVMTTDPGQETVVVMMQMFS